MEVGGKVGLAISTVLLVCAVSASPYETRDLIAKLDTAFQAAVKANDTPAGM